MVGWRGTGGSGRHLTIHFMSSVAVDNILSGGKGGVELLRGLFWAPVLFVMFVI